MTMKERKKEKIQINIQEEKIRDRLQHGEGMTLGYRMGGMKHAQWKSVAMQPGREEDRT